MTKMKVHELAKELNKQSKEIIAFLQDKGIEVKAAQSSVEEDAIAMVKKAFGQGKTEEPKKEEAAPKQTEKTPVKEQKKEEAKPAEPAVKAESKGQTEAPKKKKKIIFVSNPHNSNIPGQRQGNNDRRQGQNQGQKQGQNQGQNQRNRQGGNNRYNQSSGGPAPHKIIRPLTAPSMPETTKVDFKQNARRMETERNAGKAAEAAKANSVNTEGTNAGAAARADAGAAGNSARPAARPSARPETRTGEARTDTQRREGADRSGQRQPQSNYNNRGSYTNANNSQRTQGNERYQRNDRPQGSTGSTAAGQGQRTPQRYDNRRPEGSGYTNNQGDRSNFRGNAGAPGGNRPGGNFNRPERGNAGPDNRFRKPEKTGKGFTAEAPVKEIEKHRDEEKRRSNQERDKKSKKDFIYEEDTAAKNKANKAGRFIKPEKKVEVVEEQIKVISVPDVLTIKELADKMRMQPSVIIKKLFLQGQIVTVNSEISFEEAENIAIDYDIICEREIKVDVIEELLKEEDDEEENMMNRPPVICVMGHVDHGKTSLLDAIRKTNVTDKEAGGITQHIGAYTVNANGQSITFLDTPGHEAFTAMRMRGANATDIAILVVAADDGVMPQTVEAINHAKAAGIEIIVAVNKIDKPGANIDRVKQEMTEYELIPVDWGGTTEFVPVSAKAGEGIDTLLETILLTAEILEMKANPDRRARGLVIEAELDKGRGPVATVLVQKGTLHVGDFISAGASHGKVRAMIDDKGRAVKEALPSTPVEILGLSDVPTAGEVFIAHESDKVAKSYAETYRAQNKERMLEETKAKMSLDDLFTQIQAGSLKELNIIVKADVQGSVEAVKQSLMKLSNEEVVVKCIHGGVGAINESDVSLASASAAIIIGFNVRPDAMAKTIAEREGVDIRLYKVIYQAIEDMEAAMKGMLDPVFEEKIIGHAEVRQIFKASALGNIAGSYVLDGTFQRDCKVRISREGEQIYEGELKSLKRFKDDVKEVKAGFECGLVFEGYDQMQELDIVEAYIMVEVPR